MRILLIVGLYFPLCAIAQNKKQIEGIGIFKIAKTTTAIIDSLAKANNITVKESYKDLSYYVDLENPEGVLKHIFEIKYDVYAIARHAEKNEDIRIFYLNFYEVSGVEVRGIYLKFYKNILYEFSSESGTSNSDVSIEEAFELKYGKPNVDRHTTKQIVCQNGFGATFTHEEINDDKEWLSLNKRIKCVYYFSISYDECKPHTYYLFMVSDSLKEKEIATNEMKSSSDYEKAKQKRLREKVKDL